MFIMRFTWLDLVSINSFLEPYKTSCHHSHVNEGLNIQIVTYVLEASPRQTLISCMRYRVFSYPKVISFPLDKYASIKSIIQMEDTIENLQQLSKQSASDFTD